MEIFIGIRDNTRQLALDVDMSESELVSKVNEALASANGLLDLTGRREIPRTERTSERRADHLHKLGDELEQIVVLQHVVSLGWS